MQQIIPPIKIAQKILGSQKREDEIPYRMSVQCMCVEQPEGVLLYHTLTGEILLLTPDEAALTEKLPGFVPPDLAELIFRRFLVPEGMDEAALAGQTREIAERFEKKGKVPLTGYTIFTTTDCNARCFYCYEAGWKKSSMSEQTALDTANYIAAHCGDKPVYIRWFGGEPLVNTKAIDIITHFLRKRGLKFHSTMVSNGYLFDEALVLRARDEWNMEEVQITLDGTEDVYNKRKAYVNSDGSPYRRVLNNIGLLLDAGISAKIRLNMDGNNERDLYMLIDELAERFAGKPGFGVYPIVIQRTAGTDALGYTVEENSFYAEKPQSMRSYAEKKGIMVASPMMRSLTLYACAADNDRATVVLPDGRLSRCSAAKDGGIWGSIYSDEVDEAVLRQWRERKPYEDKCRTCVVYPQCVRLKKCTSRVENCSPIERSYREDKLRRAVLRVYEEWKAAGQS